MSDLPKIHGFCDAGCKWEVPHKSEMNTLRNTILTINGSDLKFFAGTKAEYNTLSEEEKQGLLAVITDDTSNEEFKRLVSLFGIGTPASASAVFKSLADTGVVNASCTTEEFVSAMPVNSCVAFSMNTQDMPVKITDLPLEKTAGGYQYGFCVFWKGFTANYAYGFAFDIYGDMFRYKYHTGTALETNGWSKVHTSMESELYTQSFLIVGGNGGTLNDTTTRIHFNITTKTRLENMTFARFKSSFIANFPDMFHIVASGAFGTSKIDTIFHDGTDIYLSYYLGASQNTKKIEDITNLTISSIDTKLL